MSDTTPTTAGGVPLELGEEIGGAGRSYFDQVVIDNILDALLELSAELWTQKDRTYVLERVLESRGIDVTAAIEAHRPDDEEIAERKELRRRFVDRIFAGFARRPTNAPKETNDE